jgi:hypothetical protein
VTPATTAMTVFLTIDRHGGGAATSCSIRAARRCDSASCSAALSPGAAGADCSDPWSSCVATGEL